MTQFYRIDWWATNLGPCRKHVGNKRDAFRFARGVREDSESDVKIYKIVMPTCKTAILDALDASANLGTEGATRLPGESVLIATIAAIRAARNDE